MAVALETGVVIAGRYRLDRLIGQGGMGVVWAATDQKTQKPVALKHLRKDAAGDEATRKRFIREVQATAAIDHPNIVAVHDVVKTPDGLPALVMDLLDGEPLSARLSREKKLSLADACAVLAPVVSAVGTAHSLGIVHRDLKPDNIFLCQGESGAHRISVKVLDFGIAKLTTTAPDPSAPHVITGTWALLGTPYYMSPEQIIGERDIDHRSDIWALGVILYECLTGVRPAEARTPGKIFEVILLKGIKPIAEVAPSVPADVAKLVGRMLARERVDRPADLREVRDVLARHTGVKAPSFERPAPARLSNAGDLAPRRASRQADDDEPPDSLDFSARSDRMSAISQPPSTLPAPSGRLLVEARRDERDTLPPAPPVQPDTLPDTRPIAQMAAELAKQEDARPAERPAERPAKPSIPAQKSFIAAFLEDRERIAIILGALAAGVGIGALIVATRGC